MYALSLVSIYFSRSQAIHALTVGAASVMILAMISRVSLGHTGRAIKVGKYGRGFFIDLCGLFVARVWRSVWAPLAEYVSNCCRILVFWIQSVFGTIL